MKEEKSPSDKLKEISTVFEVIESFFNESRDQWQARKLMGPFLMWLFNKSREAMSEMEESNEL